MSKKKAGEVAAEKQQPMPKMLIRRHSEFYEEEITNPAGVLIKVRKVKTTNGTSYRVSVNGRLTDCFLSLASAKKKAKELYFSEGALV